MFRNIERQITFIANVTAIITFIVAVAGWLGLGQAPKYAPTSNGVSTSLLITYCLITSYGIGRFVQNRFNSGESSFVVSMIMIVVFCYSDKYLTDILSQNLSAPETNTMHMVASAFGGLSIWISLFCMYVHRIIFPKGFSLAAYLGAPFRGGYWLGLAISLSQGALTMLLMTVPNI